MQYLVNVIDYRSESGTVQEARDISRIWVLEPEGAHYVEVPYRTMANPSVSLWEHRHALARLHE